jgi:transposase InsO family protein
MTQPEHQARQASWQAWCKTQRTIPWPTRRHAQLAILEFIAGWYNQHRRHSTLGYSSPADVERRTLPATLTA